MRAARVQSTQSKAIKSIALAFWILGRAEYDVRWARPHESTHAGILCVVPICLATNLARGFGRPISPTTPSASRLCISCDFYTIVTASDSDGHQGPWFEAETREPAPTSQFTAHATRALCDTPRSSAAHPSPSRRRALHRAFNAHARSTPDRALNDDQGQIRVVWWGDPVGARARRGATSSR